MGFVLALLLALLKGTWLRGSLFSRVPIILTPTKDRIILKGSWGLVTRVTKVRNTVSIHVSLFEVLIALPTRSHEPPSRDPFPTDVSGDDGSL